MRDMFFTDRVMPLWNRQQERVIGGNSGNGFKETMDACWAGEPQR